MLLKHGANPNQKVECGWTAMEWATWCDFIRTSDLCKKHGGNSVVQMLLKHGADPNRKVQCEWTAVEWATWCDFIRTSDLREKHGEKSVVAI